METKQNKITFTELLPNNFIELSKSISKIIFDEMKKFNQFSNICKDIVLSSQNMSKSLNNIVKEMNTMSASIKSIYDSIPKVDLSPLIDFYNNLPTFKFDLSKDANNDELLDEIKQSTLTIATTNNVTIRQKRNIFKSLFKVLSKSVVYFLLTILAPTIFAVEYTNRKAIYEAKQEIVILEKEQQESELKLDYRYIVHRTRLFKSKKLKQCIDYLEVGEVVIVLENCGKKLKVQILDTEETGWILKKYSKSI